MNIRTLFVILIAGVSGACSAGGEKDAVADASVDSAVAPQPVASGETEPRADSIPIRVTVTYPAGTHGGNYRGGTFRSEGMGNRCDNTDDRTGWVVAYGGKEADSIQVHSVMLNVEKVVAGKATGFRYYGAAGTFEVEGFSSSLIHVIRTIQPTGPGPIDAALLPIGSGTLTVAREGEGVRFEIDGISGTTKGPLRVTLVCERTESY